VRREKVLMRTVEDYAVRNLDIHFETWATEIDAQSKVVRTNRGQEFPYDALLIATGGRPKPRHGLAPMRCPPASAFRPSTTLTRSSKRRMHLSACW
jgi:NADPH-dependent 2,4-dienoyl-CoA reductase/sulfur reductase-like enzyme